MSICEVQPRMACEPRGVWLFWLRVLVRVVLLGVVADLEVRTGA